MNLPIAFIDPTGHPIAGFVILIVALAIGYWIFTHQPQSKALIAKLEAETAAAEAQMHAHLGSARVANAQAEIMQQSIAAKTASVRVESQGMNP
jgi:hypothetical protein